MAQMLNTLFPGEKELTVDEFADIVWGIRQDKDSGVYEDFIECLKLYDKAENGFMQFSELTHMITGLGTLNSSFNCRQLHF